MRTHVNDVSVEFEPEMRLAEEVAVYCVSCVVASGIGEKTPGYLFDLLFGEETTPPSLDLDAWHAALQAHIDAH